LLLSPLLASEGDGVTGIVEGASSLLSPLLLSVGDCVTGFSDVDDRVGASVVGLSVMFDGGAGLLGEGEAVDTGLSDVGVVVGASVVGLAEGAALGLAEGKELVEGVALGRAVGNRLTEGVAVGLVEG